MTPRRIYIQEIVIDGVAPGQEAAAVAAVRNSLRRLATVPQPAVARSFARVDAPGATPEGIGNAALDAVLARRTR